jgi:predicted esterase
VVGLAAANFGEYVDVPEPQRQAFSAYTDQLFMLHGYSGAKMLEELDLFGAAWDLRSLAPDFEGRAMLLITGENDTVVTPDVQARLAAAYARAQGLDITTRLIPGDHSYSSSRIHLQRQVLTWLDNHCR